MYRHTRFGQIPTWGGRPALILLLTLLLPVLDAPAVVPTGPTLGTPTTSNPGANQATLGLQSDRAGTGWFTLLAGSGTGCGTGTQVQAGQDANGDPAPYHGSLPLSAGTPGAYTVRNLTRSTAYTICFTADDGTTLQSSPATANVTTTAVANLVDPTWGPLGTAGFSADAANSISLAFAPDGSPYVAYQDGGNSNKATVMKYSGGVWDSVGTAPFSAGVAAYTSLAFAPDGSPYVAYQDSGNSAKATVMKYSGGAWGLVGPAGFSAGIAIFPSLAFAPDGSPYVAYEDKGNINKAMVMKYSGGAWGLLGTAGFSAGQIDFTSLAVAPDGTPYVAYQDKGNSRKATVMKYSGGVWGLVGTAGFSAGEAYSTSLAIAPDGTPYVAYTDSGNGDKATVMKYSGGVWGLVGTAGFSAGQAYYTSLAIAPDGTPYVAYQDQGNSGKATVMRYLTYSGGSWNRVGNAGFSANMANYTSLAFAPDGTPYVAYQAGINGKATVMKLKSATTTTLSSAPNPAFLGQSITFSATVASVLPSSLASTLATGTPTSPTGTVTFQDAAATLGAGTLTAGSATYGTAALTVGSHDITAVYGGDDNYNGSSSPVFPQIVEDLVGITVATVPAGLAVRVDGSTYTAPRGFAWIPGSSHSLVVDSPQSGATGSRYTFAAWSDGGTAAHTVIAPSVATTYTANFTAQYQLTTAVDPAAGGYVLPNGGPWYAADAVVPVKVTPNTGYAFTTWTGPVASPNSPATTVTMSAPQSLTANLTGVPALRAQVTGKSGIFTNRIWTITLSNSGTGTATNVQLTSLSLTPLGGSSCAPLLKTSPPVPVSDVDPGSPQAGSVTIDFSGCAAATKFSVQIGYRFGTGPTSGSNSYTNMLR